MTSINQAVNNLFQTYVLMTGFEIRLNMASERWLLDCVADGLTPEDFGMAINGRKLWNQTHDCKKSELLHKMVRDPEDRAILFNEIAEIKARKRVKAYSPNKAQALRDVGLPDAPPQEEAKHVKEHLQHYVDEMRKAVQ